MYSTYQCVQYIPLCINHTSWYSSYLCLQSKLVCTVHTLVYIKYRCKRQLFCKIKIVYKTTGIVYIVRNSFVCFQNYKSLQIYYQGLLRWNWWVTNKNQWSSHWGCSPARRQSHPEIFLYCEGCYMQGTWWQVTAG